MPQIVINGETYFSYASVVDADNYIRPTQYFAVWETYSVDEKGGFLITATRFLDSLRWREECGLTQADRANNEGIVSACIEIAMRLASGDTGIISGETSSEGSIQTLKAGSAQITYFNKTKSIYAGTILENLPANILAMISGCLFGYGSSRVGTSRSFGTCYPSTAKEPWGFQ